MGESTKSRLPELEILNLLAKISLRILGVFTAPPRGIRFLKNAPSQYAQILDIVHVRVSISLQISPRSTY